MKTVNVHQQTKRAEKGEKCASKARSFSIAFLSTFVIQKQKEGRCDVLYGTQVSNNWRTESRALVQDNTKTHLHLCFLPLSWVWFCLLYEDLFQCYSLNPLELSADMDINFPIILFLSSPLSLFLSPAHCRDEKHAFLMKVGILISLCYSKSWCPNLRPIVHKC